MKVTLRQERPDDYAKVSLLIEEAFREVESSDHREHALVERLRRSKAFLPALSLVAIVADKDKGKDKELAGHILLTKVRVKGRKDTFDLLALAPVSVKPAFQGKGIGGRLIAESHQVARQLGFKGVVVLGHENYYPKFGYQPAGNYGIILPFDVPAENCMVLPLAEHSLEGVNGKVEYPAAFFE